MAERPPLGAYTIGAVSPEFAQQVVDRHKSSSFHVDEVAQMSPSEHKLILHHAAMLQRDVPEHAMLRLQRIAGGGVYSSAIEHVGDLTHRLNEEGGAFGLEFVAPKVRVQLGSLASRYGFEREHREQMRYNGTDLDALKKAGQEYSRAHSDLPVYNEPSHYAQHAAVSLGGMDFLYAKRFMQRLSYAISDPQKFKHMMSQQGSVEFLSRSLQRRKAT